MYKIRLLTIYILQKRKGAIKIGITTNEILIPKKLFGAKIDKDLEFDTPIPDYCPDIARLVKVDCTPFTEACTVEDGRVTVRGKAVYDVLYETDYKNRLRCCSFTQDFSHSLPLPRSGATEISSFCSVRCERIDCKLIGPRRIVIRTALGAQFDIEGEVSVKAVAVNEDGEAFFRKKAVGFDGRTSSYEESFRFAEQLVLSRNEKAIGEIVCGSITLLPPQTTVLPERIEIKSTAAVRVLCEEENNEGKYYMSAKTVPVNIEYTNPAIEDFKRLSLSIEPSDAEFIPELDQYGENRVIKTSFNVRMKLKINEPKAYTVADDMFEKDYDSTLVKTSALLPHLYSENDVSFSAEAKLPPMMPTPETLLDATARDYGSNVEKTEGGVTVSGNFIVTLTADTAEGIHSFDHSVPYSQFFPLDIPNSETATVADTYPVEVMTTLHSDGSVTAKIIAGTKIYIYCESEETFISEITKRSPRKSTDDGSMLVYCYPSRQETLWDIAKLYRADPEGIAKLNAERFDEGGKPVGNGPVLIKC